MQPARLTGRCQKEPTAKDKAAGGEEVLLLPVLGCPPPVSEDPPQLPALSVLWVLENMTIALPC